MSKQRRRALGKQRCRKKKRADKLQRILQYLIGAVAVAMAVFLVMGIVQSFGQKKKMDSSVKGEHNVPVGGGSSGVSEETLATPTDTPTPTPSPTATPTPSPTPDPTKKRVAFTFDDGPHFELTRKFVDELKKYNGHATWFLVGNRVFEKAGEAVSYAAENGNEIAIHGWTHVNYYDECSDAVMKEELEKTAEVIKQYTGQTPKLMRPYGGRITKERIASCPYAVVLWSCDSEDWRNKKSGDEQTKKANVQKTVDNVLRTVKDGDIILMHEIYENSYEAFCILAKTLHEQGYEFVTVSELLGDAQPGHRYVGK